MNRHIRQSGGTVPTYAGARQDVSSYVGVLGDRSATVDEEAATSLGVVRTLSSGRGCERLVGVVAITEPTNESASFEVTIFRIVGGFDDHIRGNIVGVVGEYVIETTTGASVSDEEVRVC